jgi:hypothetical protein
LDAAVAAAAAAVVVVAITGSSTVTVSHDVCGVARGAEGARSASRGTSSSEDPSV